MSNAAKFSAIVQTLGNAAAERAIHKRRGGDNALRGYRFETFVAVTMLLEEAMTWFGQECPHECSIFVYQPPGFVDDLSILSDRSCKFIQIKDVTEQSWGRSSRSLAGDFRNQALLLSGHVGDVSLTLVLSLKDVADELRGKKPRDLRAVDVRHVVPVRIPFGAWTDPALSGALNCFLAEPDNKSEMVAACSALSSAWHGFEGAGTTQDLYEEAAFRCNHGLRTLYPWIEISPQVKRILNGIPDLFVEARGQRLMYWDRDGLRGKHPFPDDSAYERFESLLVARPPSTIEAFLGLLDACDG